MIFKYTYHMIFRPKITLLLGLSMNHVLIITMYTFCTEFCILVSNIFLEFRNFLKLVEIHVTLRNDL